jgi:hypothetical protein
VAHTLGESRDRGAGTAGDVERTIAGIGLCGIDQQIERGLVVQCRRGSELLGLAAELIGNGGLMCAGFSGASSAAAGIGGHLEVLREYLRGRTGLCGPPPRGAAT